MPEARDYPRQRVHAYADVIGTEVVLWRPVEDLSLGGCRVAGPAWESPGTAVALVLSFPALAVSMPVPAAVLRSTSRAMALHFPNLSDDQKAALRRHMQDSHDATATT